MHPTNMKHLILCLGLSGALSLPTLAQQTAPSGSALIMTQARHDILGGNFVGYQQQALPLLPRLLPPSSRAAYDQLLAGLITTGLEVPEEVLNTFLEQHPSSLDRERAQLLMASAYISKGQLLQARGLLERIDLRGLSEAEQAEREVYLGYITLCKPTPRHPIREARPHLERAIISNSLWGEQALLLIAALEWHEDNTPQAQHLLSERRWSKALAPEVAYLKALIGFQTQSPDKAIQQALLAGLKYPELLKRPRLMGTLGRAYEHEGDEAAAREYLLPLLQQGDLLPEEAYTLATILYKSKDYEEARKALALATSSTHEVGALAHILQGNIRLEAGERSQALLAFGAAASHPGATPQAREYAIYNSIKASSGGAASDFGHSLRLYEQYLKEFADSPRHREVYDELADQLALSKDYAASLDVIKRLDNPPASILHTQQYILCRLGELYIQQEKPELWQRYLNEAIKLGDQGLYYTEALALSARMHLSRGAYTEARDAARLALKKAQASSLGRGILHYILGYAQYNLGAYPEADRAFAQFETLATDPALRSDAQLRRGDCALVALGPSAEAIQHYRKANDLVEGGNAEALYRLQHLYGRRSDYAQQISTINQLLSKHPRAPFVAEALYDKGRAQVLSGQSNSEAEESFREIERRFPHSREARLASLERAMLHYNASRAEEAIAIYKRVIADHPTTAEARTALADLKNIYTAQSRMDEYMSYAEALGAGLKPSDEEAGHLLFLSAQNQHLQGHASSIRALQGFVQRFPSHQDTDKARLMLAKDLLATGQATEALPLLSQLSRAETEAALRLEALELLADYQYKQEQGREALASYRALYAFPDLSLGERQRAGLLVARLALKEGDPALSAQMAEQTLNLKPLSQEMQDELTLIRGKASEAQNKSNEAAKIYSSLDKRLDSPYGAEAYHSRARIAYASGRVSEAKKLLEQFIAQGSTQQYWMARSFILLSDCYMMLGDRYAAEQYISSLKENYQGGEEDIAQMINQRMQLFNKQ